MFTHNKEETKWIQYKMHLKHVPKLYVVRLKMRKRWISPTLVFNQNRLMVMNSS